MGKPNEKKIYILCISFITVLIGLLILYIYIKNKKFESYIVTENNITIPIDQTPSMEQSIKTQIAKLLNVTPRRINNFKYSSVITSGKLYVYFTIDEPNFLETKMNDTTTAKAQETLAQLQSRKSFNIMISGRTVSLLITDLSATQATKASLTSFYKNNRLIEISDYANKVYKGIQNTDESLTQYHSLWIDPLFNVRIKPPTTL